MLTELIRIVERASTLEERLGDSFVPESTDEEIIQTRLHNWKKNVANGDEALFHQRLQMEGVTPADVRRIVSDVHLRDPQQLPQWLPTLQELIESTRFCDLTDSPHREPFDEILFPFVEVAHRKLTQRFSIYVSLLSDDAVAVFERSLLRRLSRICSRPLVLELNVARLLRNLKGKTSRDRYYEFIRNLATPQNVLDFFAEYSVAARLVASEIDRWVDSMLEFIFRLQNDVPEIATRFAGGQHPGPVVAIRDHVSDFHCNGRTSKEITFESGLKLLYKPKDLTPDAAFQDFLDWINSQEKFPAMKTFSLLNKGTHGWVEFLEPQSCEDPQKIRNYFYRSGMLLAILHALGATDCHSENIFAIGEFPVLIDLENLVDVRPTLQKGNRTADEAAQELARSSLLQTGMLPRLIFADPAAKGADFSGLLGGTNQNLPFRSHEWTDSGTDRMRLESKYSSVHLNPIRPSLKDVECESRLEAGFQEMYEFLVQSKDLITGNWIERFSTGEVRYLNRATSEYSLILQKSMDPAFLKTGIDRSIHLDLLWRNLFLQDREFLSNLIKPERQALERMDIPYFSVKGSELLIDRQDSVSDLSFYSAKDCLIQRLGSLHTDDIERQIIFLRASISMHTGPKTRATKSSFEEPTPILMSTSDLLNAAISIGEKLKDCAITAPDGTISWMGAEYVPHSNQFSIGPLRNTFYSGKTGIALFFAALDRFAPDQGYGAFALRTIRTICDSFRNEKAEFRAKFMEVGAMSGIGSIAWSFLRIGQLLKKGELIEDAVQIASLITKDRISRDRNFDIVSGSAGAMLCFLALHEVQPAANFLQHAIECADHLLKQSIQEEQTRCWQTLRGERLAGFSHGASGFAYALARLFAITGKETYRNAALQAFAYERSLFSEKEKNWPDLRIDLRTGTNHSYMSGWCHGAPGITLARVGCYSRIDDPEIKKDMETGLQITLEARVKTQDDVCCGNFSRIETLLIASKTLNRLELFQAALAQASVLVQRGVFHLHPDIRNGLVNPGFMKGIAGIGYSLLRLADEKNLLPSPLLM